MVGQGSEEYENVVAVALGAPEDDSTGQPEVKTVVALGNEVENV